VPTIHGTDEIISFRPDNTDFLLKGKGIKSGDKEGDHIARITVRVPRAIDSEALEIVKELDSLV